MSVRYGVILAGGASTRMPGGKAHARIGGRTLLQRAVDTVHAAGLEAVVSSRAQTALALPPGVERWDEPETGQTPHPLRGVASALDQSSGPVVVLPVDLPFLPAEALSALAAHRGQAILATGGRPAALVARLDPSLSRPLAAAADAGAPALRTLVDLGVALADLMHLAPTAPPHALLNVNDPATLAEAETLVRR